MLALVKFQMIERRYPEAACMRDDIRLHAQEAVCQTRQRRASLPRPRVQEMGLWPTDPTRTCHVRLRFRIDAILPPAVTSRGAGLSESVKTFGGLAVPRP
jgi:hypothetical protein